MATCPSCETTLIIDGTHVQNAGSSGEMHDVPALLKLGQSIRAKGIEYQIMGHARFDYGRGWWDEFWVQGSNNDSWISVDEGDVVLQRALRRADCPENTTPPKLGEYVIAEYRNYRVTEAGTATCTAVRGVFPEVLSVGARHHYVNCTGKHGLLLSGEFSDGSPDWYFGAWLDPFDFMLDAQK
jgi:hypothetical protein